MLTLYFFGKTQKTSSFLKKEDDFLTHFVKL